MSKNRGLAPWILMGGTGLEVLSGRMDRWMHGQRDMVKEIATKVHCDNYDGR